MSKKVCIIGSGIVGILLAYKLSDSGYKVVVCDKNESESLQTSMQNGGQLSFGHIDSLSSASNLLSAIRGFFVNNSAFCYHFFKSNPFPSKTFLNWIIEYIKNIKHYNQNLKIIAQISSRSKKCFNELLTKLTKEELEAISYKDSGILHFFCNKKYFLKCIKRYQDLNLNFEILTRKQVLNIEQSLCFVKNLQGGIIFPEDKSVNCRALCNLLKNKLEKAGVEFLFKTEVNLQITDNIAKSSQVDADIYVIASDSLLYNSMNFLCEVVYPMHGYSLDIDTSYSNYSPSMALTDSKNRIVYSVHSGGLRVAGFADFFPNQNLKPNHKIIKLRTSAMLKKVYRTFPSLKRSAVLNLWSGARPSTPSSVPIVKRANNISNLYINTGHTNLGLTLSFGCAELLTEKINYDNN